MLIASPAVKGVGGAEGCPREGPARPAPGTGRLTEWVIQLNAQPARMVFPPREKEDCKSSLRHSTFELRDV